MKILCLLGLWLLLFLQAHGIEPISSWARLERDLANDRASGSFGEALHKSGTFTRLINERNLAPFLEMSAQGESTPAQIAGFYGLLELDSGLGLEVGFKMALSTNAAAFALELLPALRANASNANFG